MGIVSIPRHLLNPDSVGIICPLITGVDDLPPVDDYGSGIGYFVRQFQIQTGLNLGYLFLSDKQSRDPFGCTGFNQGHGQLIPGGG